MERIVEKAQKIVDLGKEYIEAKKYEECNYDLVTDNGQFMLFRIEDAVNVSIGTIGRIQAYCRLRNIGSSRIYASPKVLQELKNRKIDFYGTGTKTE